MKGISTRRSQNCVFQKRIFSVIVYVKTFLFESYKTGIYVMHVTNIKVIPQYGSRVSVVPIPGEPARSGISAGIALLFYAGRPRELMFEISHSCPRGSAPSIPGLLQKSLPGVLQTQSGSREMSFTTRMVFLHPYARLHTLSLPSTSLLP